MWHLCRNKWYSGWIFLWHFSFLLPVTILQIESVSSLLGLNKLTRTDRAQTNDCFHFTSVFYLAVSDLLNKRLVAEPTGSVPLIQKPTIGYDIEPVPSTYRLTTYLNKIQLNFIFRSFSVVQAFSKRFPFQNSVRIPCFSYPSYIPGPSYSPSCRYPNISWSV